MNFAVPEYPDFNPGTESIDDRSADAMKSAGSLVASRTKFPAGMQHREDHLRCRTTGSMFPCRHAATIVCHCYTVILVDRNGNFITVSIYNLIHRVVCNLVDKIMYWLHYSLQCFIDK